MAIATTKPNRVPHTLKPVPPAEEIRYPVISVDDHAVEPADLFIDRLPAKFKDQAPRVVEDEAGNQYWRVGNRQSTIGILEMGAMGIPHDERRHDPIRLDELWPGATDIDARVKDMDKSGVVASVCFPSAVFGFAGRRFLELEPELGLACVEAYNQWSADVKAAYPERFVGQQIVWMGDVDVACDQVRRNAERGFTALSFSENPERHDLPSLYSGYWDPLFDACQDTDTAVNLHVGSGSLLMIPSVNTPPPAHAVLFPANGILTSVDWIFSTVPGRFPDLRIAFSEAGIGWVSMTLERFQWSEDRKTFDPGRWPTSSGADDMWNQGFKGLPEPPLDTFHRNYYFATLGEPEAIHLRHHIGVDHIMVECDYPHADATFPHVQQTMAEMLDEVPKDEADQITYQNAARVYRHPLPNLPGFPELTAK